MLKWSINSKEKKNTNGRKEKEEKKAIFDGNDSSNDSFIPHGYVG